ncbi:MAG: LysM peptidoglycan-binding domain-containing protein [Verrucomicrobiaceae bacterium]|nr:LysM peptidoglycan-binding domain-containing protein [Verrucomicrobiaceae bacterium]
MKTKKTKNESILMRLIDGERHKHRVALVTDEGEWNQHEPNTGMARMFVVMLLIHVVLIGGIIIYDFMGEEEAPAQAITQAARATSASGSSELPQASEEIMNAQANAVANPVADTETYTVASGDSIRSIAEKHGTSEEVIIQMNRLDKGIQIGPGTLLNVPKGAVPVALGISREDAEKMVARDQPPAPQAEAVKTQDAPASIGATTQVISLVAPGEPAPNAASLLAAAETPATATPAPEPDTTEIIGGAPNPQAVALFAQAAEENEKALAAAKEPPAVTKEAEEEEAPAVREEPKRTVKTEPRLVKPNPVPTPSQMSKRLADAPPAPKKSATKSTPKSSTKSTPTKTASSTKSSSSKTHTLAAGETLYRLSTKYGVSVAALQKANGIKNPNSMRNGMKLVIPAK